MCCFLLRDDEAPNLRHTTLASIRFADIIQFRESFNMARSTPIRKIVPALLVLAIGLTACASFQEKQYKRQPASASTLAVPPAGTDGQTSAPTKSGDLAVVPSTQGTYPYGRVEDTPEARAASEGGAYIRGPEGSLWKGAPKDEATHNADIESCYRYAAAQTENDARIEQDRRAIYGDGFGDTQSVGLLSSKLRSYDHESRRRSLFSSCMRSKGYAAR